MTQVQPPAAVPPIGAAATPPSFSSGETADAVRSRMDAEFPPDPAASGTPAAPAAPAPGPDGAVAPEGADDFDLFSDESLDSLDFGNVPYRDGARLKRELFKVRDRFRPFNDAFAGLDDEQRQLLLDSAPTLGADLATLSSVSATMHPSDRAFFVAAMDKLNQGDIDGAAQMLADGAASMRGTSAPAVALQAAQPAPLAPGTQPMPDWLSGEQAQQPADPSLAPMTIADYQRMQAERDNAAAMANAMTDVRARARELGYDPDAPIGTSEGRRFTHLLELAQEPGVGGDLVKAHGFVAEEEQAIIDRFIADKATQDGSGRPTLPVDAGTAPAQTRTLETLGDADAAMRERLASVYGPDPRRRSAED